MIYKDIILVEDNSATADDTITDLENHGFVVHHFCDLHGVLAKIKNFKKKFALVCDLNLPVDGANFTKEEVESSNMGFYSGWIWLYKHILNDSKWYNYASEVKVIIYSAYITSLEEVYLKFKIQESKTYKDHTTPIDKNAYIGSIKFLIDELEN